MKTFEVNENRQLGLFDECENGQGSKSIKEGFRLYRLEIFNWGTFDEYIWKFEPRGDTTLLTGDVGSGKSTIIDALTTLLISPRKITYNKAADASAKERTTKSYVHGYYGQKSTYEGRGKPEALRDKGHSVILAVFKDEGLGKTLTLAQFFLIKNPNESPSRFFVVADKELSIAKDFTRFDSEVSVLKKRLKQQGVGVFNNYSGYFEAFRKRFGGIKEQALDLFQQTISMKKVEALTDFVRSSMLEKPNIDECVRKLILHYSDLNSAHEAILKAKEQERILIPIYNNGIKYTMLNSELDELNQSFDALSTWFARELVSVFEKEIDRLEKEFEHVAEQLNFEVDKQKAGSELITDLKIEISNSGGSTLQKLKTDLKNKQIVKEYREKALSRYIDNSEKAELPVPDTIEIFRQNKQLLNEKQEKLKCEEEKIHKRIHDNSKDLDNTKAQINTIKTELDSLRSRKTNIPELFISLRKRICENTNIGESEIPFAGELLQVKDDELAWEGAIERLLNSFSLSLLVPIKHYHTISKWVEQNHLGKKLVYYRVDPRGKKQSNLPIDPMAVAKKLDIKEDSPLKEWLLRHINQRYAHICCEHMRDFREAKQAITKNGQIKSYMYHEKDDRKNVSDRKLYVLGFSNEKKIGLLEETLRKLEDEERELTTQVKRSRQEREEVSAKINALDSLTKFKDFSEIDVNTINGEISEIGNQINTLERSNNKLRDLKKRLKWAEEENAKQEDVVEKIKKDKIILEDKLSKLQNRQRENTKLLDKDYDLVPEAVYKLLDNESMNVLGEKDITIENKDQLRHGFLKHLRNIHGAKQKECEKLSGLIVGGIATYKEKYPQETTEIDKSIESLKECTKIFEKLQKDDLPRFEERFKNMLHNNTLQNIAIFQSDLKNEENKIKDRISDINASLHSIDYNDGRYIRLKCTNVNDSEINEFRQNLKACTEGGLTGSDEAFSEIKFNLIKKIIERLNGREGYSESDKRWMKKVTDVRNWFTFSASECFRETDEEYEHYTDSGGKSGGQKEKLAYTILAAGLLYNFGSGRSYDNETSLRFVAIDEAFLKSSDDSARFGLELFKLMKFQLIIVTPLLKIPTITPFISHIGFVAHNDITHKSEIGNISIDEYNEKIEKANARR